MRRGREWPFPQGTVAMLAYYFPPLAGIASERTATFARAFPGYGWHPVVITPRDGFYHHATTTIDPDYEVVRTPSVEISRVLRASYARLARSPARDSPTTVRPLTTGRWGTALRTVTRESLYIPDAQVGWIPFAAAAASRAVRRAGTRSVIWSTSVPYSAHLAAWWVKRRTGTRWVAELRDPWSTAHPLKQPQLGARRGLDRKLERGILRSADHVVVTSDSTRHDLLVAHPWLSEQRVTVVTNGFVEHAEGIPPGNDEPMKIVYAGTVALGEETGLMLRALDEVHLRRPDSFRLVVVGPPDPWQAAANRSPARQWLELRGVRSADQARAEIAAGSALLLIQRHPAYRSVLPGKAFEYIGSRRPILALIPPDWELTTLLRDHADARLVGEDNIAAISAAVETLLDEHRSGTLQSPRVPESAIASLSRDEQARQLSAIFDRLVLAEP